MTQKKSPKPDPVEPKPVKPSKKIPVYAGEILGKMTELLAIQQEDLKKLNAAEEARASAPPPQPAPVPSEMVEVLKNLATGQTDTNKVLEGIAANQAALLMKKLEEDEAAKRNVQAAPPPPTGTATPLTQPTQPGPAAGAGGNPPPQPKVEKTKVTLGEILVGAFGVLVLLALAFLVWRISPTTPTVPDQKTPPVASDSTTKPASTTAPGPTTVWASKDEMTAFEKKSTDETVSLTARLNAMSAELIALKNSNATKVSKEDMAAFENAVISMRTELDEMKKLGATQEQVATLERKLATATTSLTNRLDAVSAATKTLATKADVAQLRKDNKDADDKLAKEIERVRQPSPTEDVVVNLILLDNMGRVQTYFKEVLESSLNSKVHPTSFKYDGKPNYWPQKILVSFPYVRGKPATGVILYTPKMAGAAVKRFNVLSCDVYKYNDATGTLRYDDNKGEDFPFAPAGASYITTPLTLPTLP